MRPYRLRTMSLIALALAGLAACMPAKQYPPMALTALDADQAQIVTVHADGDWLGTGIEVAPGDVYDISATGRWSNGALCGWTEADGAGASPLCLFDVLGYGLSPHTLIGKIGDGGKPFFVGKSSRLAPTEKGLLYLKDYDDPNFYGDNEGTLSVTIQRAAVRTATPRPAGRPTAAPPPAPASSAPPATATGLSDTPIAVDFPQAATNADDIAVIIGNADYSKFGRDIPNVLPAYGDAAGIRRYVTRALGVRDGNVIELRDATGAQLQRVFGTAENPRGQLYDWVRPSRSRVFVYYAGHGAPVGDDGSAFLVPSDADAARINLNGYPVHLLYANLGKLPAKSVTVVLEACFSGASQAGSVIAKASPVFVRPKAPPVPKGLTVIAAGAPEQMASWDQDGKHSLFTTYFLKGMAGAADAKPYGNGDGTVALTELDAYLRDTLTYDARRYYGRDQTAAIVAGARK